MTLIISLLMVAVYFLFIAFVIKTMWRIATFPFRLIVRQEMNARLESDIKRYTRR